MKAPKIHLIMVYGVAGSGKSCFAEKFAETFGAAYVDLNGLRREIFAKPEYDEAETKVVRQIGVFVLKGVLKGKQTVVMEGGIETKKERDEIRRLLKQYGYEPLLLWVQTDQATARGRVRGRMTKRQFEESVERMELPMEKEGAVVISGQHTFKTQMRIVLGQLSGR